MFLAFSARSAVSCWLACVAASARCVCVSTRGGQRLVHRRGGGGGHLDFFQQRGDSLSRSAIVLAVCMFRSRNCASNAARAASPAARFWFNRVTEPLNAAFRSRSCVRVYSPRDS